MEERDNYCNRKSWQLCSVSFYMNHMKYGGNLTERKSEHFVWIKVKECGLNNSSI